MHARFDKVYKQIKRVAKANKTCVFDRFYVCILKYLRRNVVETIWLGAWIQLTM